MDFRKLAEKQIEKALEDGVFDDLPGYGKPLPREEMQGDPLEVAGFKMMARAGAIPMEVVLRKEIAAARDRLKLQTDEAQRAETLRHIADLEMRFSMMMEQRR